MYLSTAAQEALRRPDIAIQWLVWFEAKDRETGQIFGNGIWTGEGELVRSVDGENRRYVGGAGGILQLPDFSYSDGGTIQQNRIVLSIIDERVVQAVRADDVRHCRIKVHAAICEKPSMNIIDTISFVDGRINGLEIKYDQGNAYAELAIVSNAIEGTRTLVSKKSNASMGLRNPNDGFRTYGSVSDKVQVAWGVDGAKHGRHKVTRPPRGGVVQNVVR